MDHEERDLLGLDEAAAHQLLQQIGEIALLDFVSGTITEFGFRPETEPEPVDWAKDGF